MRRSSRSIAARFCLTRDRELRDSDEVEVKELDELFAGVGQPLETTQLCDLITAHLLVDESDACTGVPPVLLEGGGQVPALQAPEAADDRPGTVATEVAHHHDRVRARLKEDVPVRRTAAKCRSAQSAGCTGLPRGRLVAETSELTVL